jgi:hypothetical protein
MGKRVAFDADGDPDFGALRSREGQAGAILIVYDLVGGRWRGPPAPAAAGAQSASGAAPIEAEGQGGSSGRQRSCAERGYRE